MPDSYFQFRVTHQGFATRLFLNDILIDSDPDGVFKKRNLLCNQFVTDGVNRVRMEISIPNPPDLPKEMKLTIALYQLTDQQISSNQLPEPLLQLEFPGKTSPSFPASLEGEVAIASGLGRWEWEDSDTIESIEKEDVAAISTLLKKLHIALSDKNLPAIQSLMELKTREMALAYHIPLATRVSDQEEFFKGIFNDTQFTMNPLSLDQLQIDPMAGNRFFVLERKDGKGLLESAELTEGYSFSLPVSVSRINGIWTIVR